MDKLQRILYATDFSDASLAAFPPALRLARLAGAELTIFHVLPAPTGLFSFESGYVPQEIWDEIYAGLCAQARKGADRLIAQAADAGVHASCSIVDGGSTEAEIVQAARDIKADLLVLGTHGRTGVVRLFLGSVAARVVATAPCPVLTVRALDTPARSS